MKPINALERPISELIERLQKMPPDSTYNCNDLLSVNHDEFLPTLGKAIAIHIVEGIPDVSSKPNRDAFKVRLVHKERFFHKNVDGTLSSAEYKDVPSGTVVSALYQGTYAKYLVEHDGLYTRIDPSFVRRVQ